MTYARGLVTLFPKNGVEHTNWIKPETAPLPMSSLSNAPDGTYADRQLWFVKIGGHKIFRPDRLDVNELSIDRIVGGFPTAVPAQAIQANTMVVAWQ